MAPLDTESQFKFLIACIKHTNAGKVDFGKVAEELSIVTKAAAAKRYERLMKAHGIEKSSSGGASGPSAPATPKAKNANNRTPASKKRKMAARGDDVDEDEDVKPDIKPEVKQEASTTTPDGSYMTDPNHPQTVTTAIDTRVKTAGSPEDFSEKNDDLLLVSESRRDEAAAHMAFSHHVLLPPPAESVYGFVDPAVTLHHLPQHPAVGTNVPIHYDYGHADYATQTTATFPPDGHHWLHYLDPVFFLGDAHLEPHVNIKHD